MIFTVENSRSPRRIATCCALLAACHAGAPARAVVLPTTDGFYGIWYSVGPSGDQYAYKYSGGFATYPQQTSPIAIYSQAVNSTFFVYAGTNGTNNTLRNYISYFDHDTGLLARPREIRNVGGNDAHKNAVLTIDNAGYLNVFANSHGNGGSGNYYKSAAPYSITDFDEIALPGSVFNNNAGAVKLAYSNAFYVSGNGYMLVYNEYDDGRAAHVATSTNGTTWTEKELFDTEDGHYTVARQNGNTIGVTADYHRSGSLDHRTNLYYVQSNNFGQTWTNVSGTPLTVPLTTRNNAALVHDYYAENQMVYMKDIDYDAAGNPILLYLTVSDADGLGYKSGPKPGGRTLHTAYWTSGAWQIRDVLMTDHNYDHGELTVEANGSWRITAPFIDGPQQYGTGGEVGVWTSANQGQTWQLADQLTQSSDYNHTYVRHPVHAHDGFYDFWADGNAFSQSASRLYFATKNGDVYRMPAQFSGEFAAPVLVTDFSNPDPEPNPGPPILAYDGLAYPNSGPAIAGRNGGSGWSGPWTDSNADFQHLKFAGAPPTSPAFPFTLAGAWLEGNGGDASREFNNGLDLSGDNGDIFVSFLLRKNVNGGASADNVEVALADGTTQVVRVGSTSDDKFYLGISVGGGQAHVSMDPITIGETYFVVLKGTSSASGSDEFHATFYDHTEVVPHAEPATWELNWATSSSLTLDTLRLALGTNATGAFDEFRLGSTWEDVAVPTLPGDFNGDGRVDAGDYVVWRNGLNTTYSQNDYIVWRANFGAALDADGAAVDGGNFGAVPEPAAWSIVLTSMFLSSIVSTRMTLKRDLSNRSTD
jgi:hypothetical protein